MKSRRAACEALSAWCEANGTGSFAAVGPEEAGRFIAASARDVSPATVASRLSSLRQVFSRLAAAGLAVNPFEDMKSTAPSAPRSLPTPDAVRALVESIDPASSTGRRDRAIVALLYGASFRPGRLASLRRGEIEIDPTGAVKAAGSIVDASVSRHVAAFLAATTGGPDDMLLPSLRPSWDGDGSIGVTGIYHAVASRAADAGIVLEGGAQALAKAGPRERSGHRQDPGRARPVEDPETMAR